MPVVDPAAIQVAKDEVPGCTDVWFSQTTHTEGTVTVVREEFGKHKEKTQEKKHLKWSVGSRS